MFCAKCCDCLNYNAISRFLISFVRFNSGLTGNRWIVRNPFDNISTMCLKHGLQLEGKVDYYFSFCVNLAKLRQQFNDIDWLIVRHESLIDNPGSVLKEICHFLGLKGCDKYLNDCASIVYQSPIKSRYEIEWKPNLIKAVEERISEYDFLSGYCYDERG